MRATRFLGCARLLASLLVSYTASPLGIKCFQAWYAAIGESWTRSILVTNSASLSKASWPLTNSSGLEFQFTQVTENH